MAATHYPTTRLQDLLLHIVETLLIGAVLTLAGLGLALAGFQFYFAGRIYPGISVAGVALDSLKPAEAAALIARQVDYPVQGQIQLRDGEKTWQVTPGELGYFLDPESSAMAAFHSGRSGDLFSRMSAQLDTWLYGIDLPPVMVFDQRVGQKFLQELARQIDKPVLEAGLGLQGAEVVVHSGQIGRTLDIPSTLAMLSVQFETLQDGEVPLFVRETAPMILDTNQQAEIARRILSETLTLTVPDAQEGDPGPWTFDPQTLANMLSIERVDEGASPTYQIMLNPEILHGYLANIAPSLLRERQNARYVFNDETHQLEVIEHAVIGRQLDIDASVQAINERVVQGEHSVPLTLSLTRPEAADDTTGEQLGITELVHSETSYFRGSSAARIQNIKAAASRFHGLLIPPGGTFSMAESIGDVSLDTGYAEALIIIGDRTIKGVGGGVCQVSTTLFRTVFFAGFPIVERHAHAYRVTYYEQKAGSGIDPNLAGLDATVFVPVVDFKFQNDTQYWLLMETYVEGASLTWKFYSTSDDRTVDWNTTGLTNIKDPEPPLYRENPDLKEGELKQIEWAVKGADVTVNRTVYRNGSVHIQDQYYTHFIAWREVWEFGPGTEVPTPEPTEEE